MLGEKETHKYLGMLEVDTTKQGDMKEKNEIRESNLSCAAEILSNGKRHGLLSL